MIFCIPAYAQSTLNPAPIFLSEKNSAAAQDQQKTFKYFKKLPIPPEPAIDQEADKTINMGPLRQYSLLPLSSLQPIRLEARYNEPLTLSQALHIAEQNSFPIRIAAESFRYQRYQFIGELFGFLPSFSTGWGLTYSRVEPVTTSANSRTYQATVRYPVFLGGNAFYTALAQYYRMKGWKQAYYATQNDALLDVYIKYNTLVLNNAILQIRVKSFQFSQAQLELNNSLYKAGTGTQFAIMQSRAQLAADEQALLQQQAGTRQAALALSYSLNLPMAINLIPADELVSENPLLSEKVGISQLLGASLSHRPELKQYEYFRLAANRQIQVASSALYPTVSFFTTFTHASTSVYPADNSAQLNGIASGQVAGATNVGTASNTALNQTASFSPGSNNVGTQGANTTATVVAGGGGNPIASTQSGSLVTSGAVAPSFNVNTITGASGSSNISGANTASAGVFPGLTNTFQAGLAVSWSLPNLGQGNVASILSARSLARQALMQANQELLMVSEEVRFSYCSKVAAREQIDATAYGVKSAAESLRLASLRLQTGVGTNLELIQAQRDYVAALTAQAQAIATSNVAQAQVLHDSGLISVNNLIKGYGGQEPDRIKK